MSRSVSQVLQWIKEAIHKSPWQWDMLSKYESISSAYLLGISLNQRSVIFYSLLLATAAAITTPATTVTPTTTPLHFTSRYTVFGSIEGMVTEKQTDNVSEFSIFFWKFRECAFYKLVSLQSLIPGNHNSALSIFLLLSFQV